MRTKRLYIWTAAALLIALGTGALLAGYLGLATTPEIVTTGQGLEAAYRPAVPMLQEEGDPDLAVGALLAYVFTVLGTAGFLDGVLQLTRLQRKRRRTRSETTDLTTHP